MSINFDNLFEHLSDEGFQEADTGLLMFPIYIYTYEPDQEYEARKSIKKLNEQLSRPANNLQCQLINIYDFFIEYLKKEDVGGVNMLEAILDKEKEESENTRYFIEDKLNEDALYDYLGEQIKQHFTKEPVEKKAYLLMYGFGNLFPYLRVHTFTKNIEKIVKNFKLIIFYPGTYVEGSYKMFNSVKSENAYRATNLNQIID